MKYILLFIVLLFSNLINAQCPERTLVQSATWSAWSGTLGSHQETPAVKLPVGKSLVNITTKLASELDTNLVFTSNPSFFKQYDFAYPSECPDSVNLKVQYRIDGSSNVQERFLYAKYDYPFVSKAAKLLAQDGTCQTINDTDTFTITDGGITFNSDCNSNVDNNGDQLVLGSGLSFGASSGVTTSGSTATITSNTDWFIEIVGTGTVTKTGGSFADFKIVN